MESKAAVTLQFKDLAADVKFVKKNYTGKVFK